MKKNYRNRILSLLLSLAMLLAALPIGRIGANAEGSASVSVLFRGEKADRLVLMQDEKVSLTAEVTGIGNPEYRWQILADRESDRWVNIKGYTKDFCVVSYALIGSMLDDAGNAFLRCAVTEGDSTYLSNIVTVNLSYQTPVTYDPPAVKPPLRASSPLSGADGPSGEELQQCTIVIHYQYEDGRLAYQPFIATIEYGGSFSHTAISPSVIGYKPYILDEETGEYVLAENMELNYQSVTADQEYTVVYRPAPVNYTVRHYTQNEQDDHYQFFGETTGLQLTGSPVPDDCAIGIDGFSALYYERLVVAADGSTVIEIYYDRNYYLADFDLGGGYGVEPIYARYEARFGANEPTRAGYDFDGWEPVSVDGREPTPEEASKYDLNDGRQINLPFMNLTYRAKWKQSSTTYTVVYWRENADDGYSYWAHETKIATSGDTVSGSDGIGGIDDVTDEAYFTYNPHKTDMNVLVEGDGSTVVNVYYTRNVYTIHFKGIARQCALLPHTHGNGCNRNLLCELNEHTHGAACPKELTCTIPEHSAHTEDCLTCGQDEHLAHGIDCLSCGKEAHTHTAACCTKPEHQHTTECCSKSGLHLLTHIIGYNDSCEPGNCSNGGNKHSHGDGTCVYDHLEHTHTDACYSDEIHEHTDACYKDTLHTHTDGCYRYSCDITEHTHTDDCYSACTLTEHQHTNQCDRNDRDNVIYTLSAKYEQTIGDVWPTADMDMFSGYTLNGWKIEGDSATAVSKRINMTADLCDTSDGLKIAAATSGGRTTYLYYMFESFDQTSPANGDDRILRNRVYYDKSTLYYQQVNSNAATWNQKEILGMTPVANGVSYDGNKVFLYYNRNEYALKFHSAKSEVKTIGNVLYEYPLKDLKDSSGQPIGSFVPDYPTDLEPNAYEFKGWYTTPECFDGTEFHFDSATMPASDLMLYAKWAPVQHEVNVYLDATLQQQIGTTQLVDHRDMANAPEGTVENGNYVFAGWFYQDENGEEKAFVFNSMPITRPMNIYAKWSSKVAVQYTVNYELEDGTPIAAPTVGSTLAGMNKTFMAKGGAELYSNYQEGYFPETNSHTVTMSVDGSNEFTFVYVKMDSVSYTVHYVNKATGQPLLDPKEVKDNNKAVVTEVFRPITGYMPDAYQKRLVLSASNPDQNVITFYYTVDTEHSYYRIVHYVQNLAGTGYTEYRSIESVGDIGTVYSAEALTISGFAFAPGKSEVNGMVTPATGTTVSGTLKANGLLIELFYDRKDVGYTVKYLESGSNNQLAEPKQAKGKYGDQVVENAIKISGYKLVSVSPQTLTLAATAERNVITFYYQEENVTIQYIPVGNGSVSIGSETIGAINGKPGGSVPTAEDGYLFEGWYTDQACSIRVDAGWVDGDFRLNPQKGADGLYQAGSIMRNSFRHQRS